MLKIKWIDSKALIERVKIVKDPGKDKSRSVKV